ncbi:MAG: EamA family transporter [bacterium]|nr:EamA family transporter [bacterium]
MWILFAILSAVFASLSALFSKIGVKDVNTNLAIAIRTLVLIVMAWGIVFARGEQAGLGSISKGSLWFLLISGAAAGMSWIFYFKALQDGPLSIVAPIDKLSIALTIILSVLFLHEELTIKTLIGAVMIISGIVVLII